MDKDYYKILGVNRSANKNEIKKAFHKLAHKYHPDKSGGDGERFKEVNEAYTILSDDKKRAEYDAYGRVFGGNAGGDSSGFSRSGGFDFSGFDMSGFQEFDLGDIFGDIFGGTRGRREKRGRDISIDIEISFKDSIFGIEKNVLITKTSVCDSCSGSGALPGSKMKSCSKCNGKGQIHEARRSILGTFTTTRTCSVCAGLGKIPEVKCRACAGAGVKRKEEDIKISIPPGINDGEMIRISGAGEAIRGGVAGDLYIKVHVEKDAVFHKEGKNLVMKLEIKLSDALLGMTQPITLPGGEKINIKIPVGVNFGEILRVRGAGIPADGRGRGDLLVKIGIKLPTRLSKKTKKIVEELRKEGI